MLSLSLCVKLLANPAKHLFAETCKAKPGKAGLSTLCIPRKFAAALSCIFRVESNILSVQVGRPVGRCPWAESYLQLDQR